MNYKFVDLEIAHGNSIDWSFPDWPSHIDHIIISNELFSIFDYEHSHCTTIKIDEFMDGGFYEYDQNISDHRPVGLKLATEFITLGDVDEDGELNIIDVIIIVNMILGQQQMQDSADLNQDSFINASLEGDTSNLGIGTQAPTKKLTVV